MQPDLRNLKPNAVFETSIENFGNELRRLLDPKKLTPAFLLKMQDDVLTIKKDKPDIKPPFFTYRLGDVSINEEGLPAERFFRLGLYRGGPKSNVDSNTQKPIDPNLPYKNLHLIPVNLNIAVEYHCSYKEQIRFSQMWLFLAVKRFKLFEIDYDGAPIAIHADFDKNITYSDIDFDNDSITTCQTNAMMQTYIGKDAIVKPMSQVTAREKIVGRADEQDTSIRNEQNRRVYTDDVIIVSDSGLKRIPER